ncbi:MAG TPA: hypothetical protein VMD91_05535 [Candidatus Sulfotelmatobacter sp.]|nr:hypothetical protein [Candidatus Sulfotelmatobacter sp.]
MYRTLLRLGATLVAAGGTLAASAAPIPPFVPSQPAASVVYGYRVDGAGPRGTQSEQGVLVITRLAGGRAVATLVPDGGTASAVAFAVTADGTLHALPPAADAGAEEWRGGTATTLPGLRALAALLATPAAGAAWPVAVEAGDPGAPATIGLTAHLTLHGTDRTISADGSGTVDVLQPPSSTGGRGGFGRGGGFPGGGGGGFPGGMGGGRRRGGASTAPQRVSATLAVHVEATFRNGAFFGARGTETTTPQSGDTTPRTATWELSPT